MAINNPLSFKPSEGVGDVKENIVLWCGRVGTGFKRVDIMLEVWRRTIEHNHNWKLIVLGGGNIDYWENYVSKRKIENVEFAGFTDVEEYYQKAKILCMTSTAEGWGLVLVEAMAYGVVPMAFDSSSSIYDIIEDGVNGRIIHSFDVDEYAENLSTLMKDEAKRERMAMNGPESIARFDPEVISRKWIELFQEVLEERV